jgi:hypothetical protein
MLPIQNTHQNPSSQEVLAWLSNGVGNKANFTSELFPCNVPEHLRPLSARFMAVGLYMRFITAITWTDCSLASSIPGL